MMVPLQVAAAEAAFAVLDQIQPPSRAADPDAKAADRAGRSAG
jgi:hypothetical protein